MLERMKEDLQCIKDRDPAARSALEILLLYPGLKAIRLHRLANKFYKKYGFELKEEVKVPNTDLTLYAMLRKANKQ